MDRRIIYSLYIYFGNTVHIKIVQIMHRSYKLILKNDKKLNIQYYTQYNMFKRLLQTHSPYIITEKIKTLYKYYQ